MGFGVADKQQSIVRLDAARELVLVRYEWKNARFRETVGESVEGFVRPLGRSFRPAPRHYTRPALRRMGELTHVDPAGKARMVDVTGKRSTPRMARASGSIAMRADTLEAIRSNAIAKGDVLGVARVAGIQAAKKTADLVPLCHQIPLSTVEIDFELDQSLPGVRVVASASTEAQTGVEMEALVAVSVSLITLYDMAKGVDKGMRIGEISLLEKRGGKSGDWVREA